MLGLTIIISFLSVMLILNGIIGKAPTAIVLGITLFALFLVIRLRFKVNFNKEQISSTGFLTTKTLKWTEIQRVIRLSECKYPKNKFYGPFEYQFQGSSGNLKINFKLFPIECMENVFKNVEESDKQI